MVGQLRLVFLDGKNDKSISQALALVVRAVVPAPSPIAVVAVVIVEVAQAQNSAACGMLAGICTVLPTIPFSDTSVCDTPGIQIVPK